MNRSTPRGVIALAQAGSEANGTLRTIADPAILEPETIGSAFEMALGIVVTPASGNPASEELQIPTAEALRYWGPDSSFRVKVMVASVFPSGTLTEDERAAVREIGWKTILTSIAGYAVNVSGADVGYNAVAPLTYPCIRQTVLTAAKSTPAVVDFIGNIAVGTPRSSYAADTAFAKVVTATLGDCVTDLSQATAQAGAKKAINVVVKSATAESAKLWAEGFAKVFAFGIELGSLSSGVQAALPFQGTSDVFTWTVRQTWLSAIDFRAADTTAALTQSFVPSTAGIPIIPMARLATTYKSLPADANVTASVSAGIGYNLTTRKMIAYQTGVGTVNASWITSPSGARTTNSHVVNFCGIDSLKTVGTGPDTVTLVMDTVRFTHFVKNSCTHTWQPWTKVKMQATASPSGMKTGLTSTPSGNSINSISFTMPGPSARFTTEFYSADWTYLNRRSAEKIYQPAQASIRNFNIDPKAMTLPANQSASVSITLGDIVDHYGNSRPYPICLRRVAGATPSSCKDNVTVTGAETGTVNFTGYSSTIPYLLSPTIGVRINQPPLP